MDAGADGEEKERISRLARIGFDNIKGYLNGGIKAGLKEYNLVKIIFSLGVNEFESLLKTGKYILLDVRNKREVEKEKRTNCFFSEFANTIKSNRNK